METPVIWDAIALIMSGVALKMIAYHWLYALIFVDGVSYISKT